MKASFPTPTETLTPTAALNPKPAPRMSRSRPPSRIAASLTLALVAVLAAGCTQEQQNKIGRDIQNWT